MQVKFWLEFILMFVVCSPLLFIVYKMNQKGSDIMRSRIKSEMDRHNSVKRLYEERKRKD